MSPVKLYVRLVAREQQALGQPQALFHSADAVLPRDPPQITPLELQFLHPSTTAHDFSPFCPPQLPVLQALRGKKMLCYMLTWHPIL